MEVAELERDLVDDLVRSCWVVEAARARVYGAWASADPAIAADGELAARRAELIRVVLEERGRDPDETLVEPHSGWMKSVAGETAGEVPLGAFFIDRLGLWVDNHLPRYLGDEGAALTALGDEGRARLAFPDTLPPAPPFEPIATIEVEPPGEVRTRFAILGDAHFGSRRAEEHVRAAIADIHASGAELVIQLGDLTDHGNPDEFEEAAATLSELEIPLVTMMGNHDVFSYNDLKLAGRDLYPASFGRQPDGVVVEHKGFRLCVLDSVEHVASPFPAFDFASGAFNEGPGGAIVRGALSTPQHELLAEIAAPGSGPAFVFLHHPPQPFPGFPPIVFGLRDVDTGRLHATIDSGNVWGVFAGHTHRNFRTRDFDGIPAHEVAIARDFPFGYGLVDVTDEGYAYRFVQLSDEALLEEAYGSAGQMWRRYALGPPGARGFTWTVDHH